jgi:FemAB-related protein (PEP-CTERM system-associated)
VLPRRFYAAIVEEFGPAVELSAVRGPEGPVAALMTFTFRNRVMPYYGGATPAARPLHAYDLLYWSLMERAAARGTLVYDFGRSKRGTGSFDYKTYWGFKPEPLQYRFQPVRKTELPDVNPLNPKYRLMIAAWQRLPLAVANAIGPVIARQLG